MIQWTVSTDLKLNVLKERSGWGRISDPESWTKSPGSVPWTMSVACYQGRIGCAFFLASFFFFFFFFLFSFAFFALFFPLILRFSGSSSILLRNTKTSLWSRRCKRQKQHPSGSEWYNECVRCDLKVYKKKQEKSGLENWLSCRRNLPTPPPQLFISLRRR